MSGTGGGFVYDPFHTVVNKQPVMARYLADTYQYSMASLSHSGTHNNMNTRYRNPSGSLCSENMSMSSRSSPMHEMEQGM